MHDEEKAGLEPRSGVIWITGFSAAGKTSVARQVEHQLRDRGVPVILLDGDDLRSIFARRWGFEHEDRLELARVYFRLCSHLASQGHVVVISAVAMYDEVRSWVRANIPRSTIVYLDVPREVRLERDASTKQVYAPGADLESGYDVLSDPDLRLENHGGMSPTQAAATVVDHFLSDPGEVRVDHGRSQHWDEYYRVEAAVPPPSPFALAAEERFAPGSRVIEVGCGNGRDSVHFAGRGHHVTGTDPSEAAIALCRHTHAASGAGFVQGSLPDVATSTTDRFDVLYSRFVLHAMTEDEERRLWRAASQVLTSGALVAVECRSILDPLARTGEVLSPTERIAGHYRRFIVLDDLISRMAASGLEVVDAVESAGLAVHGDDDPVVIRVFARNG